MNAVTETFTQAIGDHWKPSIAGNGRLEPTGHSLRLINGATTTHRYTNAQIDDYQDLPRRAFRWQPPLTLTVRARFSHPAAGEAGSVSHLSGTAGFGLWNDPFLMSGLRAPALPRAIWFFYASPPSDMKLDLATPGQGWKAAMIDALRPRSFLLAPCAPLLAPLMRLRSAYHAFWPSIQRALNIREATVNATLTAWHTYTIYWGIAHARFTVDGEPVLVSPVSPRGPLGLVIWLDNQYMVATPQGRLGHGYLAAPGPQWLELAHVSVQPGIALESRLV